MDARNDRWDPAQYERFRVERRLPFRHLLDAVRVERGGRVVDLGCGTGELTAALHERVAAAETLGIDSSPAMLSRAGKLSGGGLHFEERTIEEFAPGPVYDLVFSNAALQWLDDHPALFARLGGMLEEGGRLAVQMPANHDQPAHRTMAAVAGEEPFRSALGGWIRKAPVLRPEEYATLLHGLGLAEVTVWLRVYLHELPDADAVVEWMKGTALTAYERRLPPNLFPAFVDRYRERLVADSGDPRPYLLTYNRIFLTARR